MKTQKISADIEKTKSKISELQTKLRELEKRKVELENTEILELVRAVDVTPHELAIFIKQYKEQGTVSFSPTYDETEKSSNGTLIFILIAALAVGGAGYYFKIYRPKQESDSDDFENDDDYEDEYDFNEDMDEDYIFEDDAFFDDIKE